MNRREFITLTIAGAMIPGLFHCSREKEKDKPKWVVPKDAPNVLFMVIDDLNDWIGCMAGHPDAKTPHLDRLAQRGVLFTNAHCTGPFCNPSRTSVLVGLRPSTTGVYLNRQPFRSLLPEALTLPQYFMAHGYRVVGGGKIFNHPDPESWHEYFPSKQRPMRGLKDPKPSRMPLSRAFSANLKANFDWGPIAVPDAHMSDYKTARWAVEVLNSKHDKPFFLGVGMRKPHLPWYVPRKYFEPYPPEKVTLPPVNENDLDDIPPIGKMIVGWDGLHEKVIKANQWRQAVSAYLANISFTDAMVGKVLDALQASAYAENTIVVLWSDHGFHLGEKLHWRKLGLWEESTHTPLIFAAPDITKPGGRCARSVSLLDIYPTLIDLCGLAPRDELEGNSLLPLLEAPTGPWEYPAITTAPYVGNSHSVRTERWRYIRYHDDSEELYDHAVDEFEWVNLANKPEYNGVKAELTRWLRTVNAPDAPFEIDLHSVK